MRKGQRIEDLIEVSGFVFRIKDWVHATAVGYNSSGGGVQRT